MQSRPELSLPASWGLAIFSLWAAMACFGITRLTVGLWSLRRLRKDSVPVDVTQLEPMVREVIEEFQRLQSIPVCTSGGVRVPTAVGFSKPAIILPPWILHELSPMELHSVLLHESAHLRRGDAWTNLLQKLARTLFFFHPAVWWIERQLSLEREMACDEAVLAQTGNARGYAECLVALAEKSLRRRGLALAQAVIGRVRETSLRLAHILDDRRSPARVSLFAWSASAVLIIAGLVISPEVPQLVSFRNEASGSARVDASAPRLSHDMVVPAKLRADRTIKPQTPITKSAAQRSPKRVTQPRAVMARSGQHGAQDFLLVVRSTEYDPHGFSWVKYSVWRVTLTSPEQKPVQQRIYGRSI